MNDQKVLLRIVQTWNINHKPEYRGFRCVNCQKTIRKGWYHWLITAGYKTPVHFCNRCEKKFRLNKIEVKKPIVKVNRSKFIKFPENIKSKLQKAVHKWNTKYKIFTPFRNPRFLTGLIPSVFAKAPKIKILKAEVLGIYDIPGLATKIAHVKSQALVGNDLKTEARFSVAIVKKEEFKTKNAPRQ